MKHKFGTFLMLTLCLSNTSLADNPRGKSLMPECSEPDPMFAVLRPSKAMAHPQEISFERSYRHYASNRRGFDVSHYQGNINWAACATDEAASFVYIKATENISLIDDKFQTNLREARRAGIPAGCYHFFSPSADPLAQLRNLINAVPDLRNHDLIPVVDVEKIGGNASTFRYRLSVFLRGFEDYYHMKPIIYTGMNFYNKYLAGNFNDYKFWIAKYSEGVPELDGNCQFIMWQYTAKGHIAGIRGNVDCNCFMDGYNLSDILIKKR